MSVSHEMNIAWKNFTISRVTSRLIGTMFVKSRTHVKKLLMK